MLNFLWVQQLVFPLWWGTGPIDGLPGPNALILHNNIKYHNCLPQSLYQFMLNGYSHYRSCGQGYTICPLHESIIHSIDINGYVLRLKCPIPQKRRLVAVVMMYESPRVMLDLCGMKTKTPNNEQPVRSANWLHVTWLAVTGDASNPNSRFIINKVKRIILTWSKDCQEFNTTKSKCPQKG